MKERKDYTVKISAGEYKDLLMAYYTLAALENYGVDNWDGYCDALNEYEADGLSIEEAVEQEVEDTLNGQEKDIEGK